MLAIFKKQYHTRDFESAEYFSHFSCGPRLFLVSRCGKELSIFVILPPPRVGQGGCDAIELRRGRYLHSSRKRLLSLKRIFNTVISDKEPASIVLSNSFEEGVSEVALEEAIVHQLLIVPQGAMRNHNLVIQASIVDQNELAWIKRKPNEAAL